MTEVQKKQIHKQSPTQLSAVRVDENWEIVEDFSTYIMPMNPTFYDWKHVAYSGGKPDQFIHAPHCYPRGRLSCACGLWSFQR